MLQRLMDKRFDIAMSFDLKIDHSIVCPIIATRSQAAPPIAPIYANIFAPPLPPPRRLYDLGRAPSRVSLFSKTSKFPSAFSTPAADSRRNGRGINSNASVSRTRRGRGRATSGKSTCVDWNSRALACTPKLHAADEAMAGLSRAEVDDILELLFRANAEGVAVVMIEHIMRAVTAFAERLVVFVAGRAIADGPTAEVLRRKDVEAAYLGE